MSGTPADLLGLGFLLRIMELLFGEAIKDRLSPKSPTETARERAFDLYEILGQVRDSTDLFVIRLQLYISSLKIDVRSREFYGITARWHPLGSYHSWSSLRNVARDLGAAMDRLTLALEAVNPQLEIHRSALVQGIEVYVSDRTDLLTDLGKTVESFLEYGTREIEVDLDPSDEARLQAITRLERLLHTAQVNQALIKKIVEDLRAFLAAEFSFKESF